MTSRRALVLLAALAGLPANAAERLPEWARAVAAVPYAAEAADVPAVALLRETEIVVEGGGGTRTRERRLVRCVTAGCADHAVAAVPYLRGTQRVDDLRITLVPPDGAVRVLGARDVVDVAADAEALYDESRVAVLSARHDVGPGTLVAMEWTRRDSYAFSQDVVRLQDRLPVVAARCSVELPPGWRVEATAFDLPPPVPRTSGTRTTWEASGLPFRPDEPLAVSSAVPRLALTFRPAAGTKTPFPPFGTWDEVSRWAATLFDPAAAPSDAVVKRARERAVQPTPRERLGELGRLVQGLTYISLALDLGRGGGYRPRPAADVLARGYGDCKDKATLLRALLAATGTTAHPFLVCARAGSSVRAEFPSPFPFDHVILAVAGIAARPGEPVIEVPGIGALLLFDPTDPFTPVGGLPEALWGGEGLLVTAGGGRLVTVPSGNARLERHVTGELTADGSFRARLVETGSGAAGESLRALGRRATAEEIVRGVERWVSAALPGVRVEKAEVRDEAEGPVLDLSLAGRLPGVQAAGSLVVVRPVLVPWRGLPSLPLLRRSPVALVPRTVVAEYRLKLPAAFAVSELPPPVALVRPFGRYAFSVEESEGTLVVKQELRLERALVPVSRYAPVREFVSAVLASRDAAVVLKRRW